MFLETNLNNIGLEVTNLQFFCFI